MKFRVNKFILGRLYEGHHADNYAAAMAIVDKWVAPSLGHNSASIDCYNHSNGTYEPFSDHTHNLGKVEDRLL